MKVLLVLEQQIPYLREFACTQHGVLSAYLCAACEVSLSYLSSSFINPPGIYAVLSYSQGVPHLYVQVFIILVYCVGSCHKVKVKK